MQYIEQQLKILNDAKENGYDISHLVDPEFNSMQLKVLADAYRDNLNISLYLNAVFPEKNMALIADTQRMLRNFPQKPLEGLTELQIIAPLCNPNYTIAQLERLSQGLKNGYNIRPVATPECPEGIMKEYFRGCYQGVDLSPYLNDSENEQVLAAIRRCLVCGYDVSPCVNHGWNFFTDEQMLFLLKQVSQGEDVTSYANSDFSIEEMKAIKDSQSKTSASTSKPQRTPVPDESYVDALYDLLYNNTVITQFEDCTDNQGYDEQHILFFPNGTEWPSEYYHTENGSFDEQIARNAISLACILGKQQELYAAIDDACSQKLTK